MAIDGDQNPLVDDDLLFLYAQTPQREHGFVNLSRRQLRPPQSIGFGARLGPRSAVQRDSLPTSGPVAGLSFCTLVLESGQVGSRC